MVKKAKNLPHSNATPAEYGGFHCLVQSEANIFFQRARGETKLH